TVIAEGQFVSHEHSTSGTVRIIENADGSRRLELVNLNTSNGPDLRVWLTDRPVVEGREGWGVFDDGKYVEVGRLKGNQGNQVYAIPPGTDLQQVRSVTIWCKRFSVSFGAASLEPA
ncbi:MAG TPA: DM13 domain-containing protein, partial [Micromonosporaceae bacterium]|nr:DM13 domain-containing protein [Micromonosporaceae bacterium]